MTKYVGVESIVIVFFVAKTNFKIIPDNRTQISDLRSF